MKFDLFFFFFCADVFLCMRRWVNWRPQLLQKPKEASNVAGLRPLLHVGADSPVIPETQFFGMFTALRISRVAGVNNLKYKKEWLYGNFGLRWAGIGQRVSI